jgi:hypothetical protein
MAPMTRQAVPAKPEARTASSQGFQRLEPLQGLDGPVLRLGHGAQLPRPFLDLGAIAALEPHTPAEAGHRVDDQAKRFELSWL